MIDTNKLINMVAFDIISITTVWALINTQYGFFLNIDNKFLKINIQYSPIYGTLMGFGTSLLLLKKYYN